MHAVEIDGELNLVAALGLYARRRLDRDLLTLADRVQEDLSAHQLGDFNVGFDEVVGCMCEDDVLGAEVLSAQTEHNRLADIGAEYVLTALALGDGYRIFAEIDVEAVAVCEIFAVRNEGVVEKKAAQIIEEETGLPVVVSSTLFGDLSSLERAA